VGLAGEEDWKAHYECLNLIRGLNKYHREYILGGPEEEQSSSILSALSLFISNQVNNLRSNVSKCALMLIKELFREGTT
jgi:hypothetical protein